MGRSVSRNALLVGACILAGAAACAPQAQAPTKPASVSADTLRTSMLAGSASTFGLSRDYAVIVLTTTWKNSGRLGEIVLFMGMVTIYEYSD